MELSLEQDQACRQVPLGPTTLPTDTALDLFIAHPVSKFVPEDVPSDILGLMPASTDWYVYSLTEYPPCEMLFNRRLDGLNKPLPLWDSHYYMTEFRGLCAKERMPELSWPKREYIIQVARFDPAKGIPSVIDAFCKFRRMLEEDGVTDPRGLPQLLICGHGAVDDPDASVIYDQILEMLLWDDYKKFARDITVMRVPPSDQRK